MHHFHHGNICVSFCSCLLFCLSACLPVSVPKWVFSLLHYQRWLWDCNDCGRCNVYHFVIELLCLLLSVFKRLPTIFRFGESRIPICTICTWPKRHKWTNKIRASRMRNLCGMELLTKPSTASTITASTEATVAKMVRILFLMFVCNGANRLTCTGFWHSAL